MHRIQCIENAGYHIINGIQCTPTLGHIRFFKYHMLSFLFKRLSPVNNFWTLATNQTHTGIHVMPSNYWKVVKCMIDLFDHYICDKCIGFREKNRFYNICGSLIEQSTTL